MEIPLSYYLMVTVPFSVLAALFLGIGGWVCRPGARDEKVKIVLRTLVLLSLTFVGPIVGGVIGAAYLPSLYIPLIVGWCAMCVMAFVPHPYDIVRTVSR